MKNLIHLLFILNETYYIANIVVNATNKMKYIFSIVDIWILRIKKNSITIRKERREDSLPLMNVESRLEFSSLFSSVKLTPPASLLLQREMNIRGSMALSTIMLYRKTIKCVY